MKPYHLLAAAALALVAGTATARAEAGTCTRPVNVVLYDNDTVNLANALGANAADCTDYWISITPTAAGLPRGGAPLNAIHALGPHFHALADLRLATWATLKDQYGGWYAAGVAIRSAMTAAGYTGNDTWDVDEVGTPSKQLAEDVFAGAAGARAGFRDWIRGLYDGGGAPDPGVVLAADPPQYSSDLAAYEQGLAAWYADGAFWDDLHGRVRFWAQETYADARSWGVDGAGLDARASHLGDYYLHGLRLAGTHGDATAAVRSFFADAYTPIGNAAWRYPVPAPGPDTIAFGYTDVPLPDLLSFVSTQTYALRSSAPDRFGFVTWPNLSSGTLNAQVYARVAAAVHDSQADPAGACSGGRCDGVVAGAAFTEAWRDFATPPQIVPQVSGTLSASGWYTSDATVSWTVTDAQTPVTSTAGCDTVVVDADTAGATYTCTATSSGGTASASVTIRRDATPPEITCAPTPEALWPPNGRLVPVSVAVEVTDGTSGPAGFALTSAPSSDAADFAVGTPDVAGLLRAQRPGDGGDRVYTLGYTAQDVAGNTATCDAQVVVPHDRGS